MVANILTIGDNSLIALYNWALSNNTLPATHSIFHYSQSVNTNKCVVKLNDLIIRSNSQNQIKDIDSFSLLSTLSIKFDLIVMHCNSLVAYSDVFSELIDNKLLSSTKTKIIIENTGSIPLNDFAELSFPEELSSSLDFYYSLSKVNFKPTVNEKNEIEYELKTNGNNQIQLTTLSKTNFDDDREITTLMKKIFRPYQIDFFYVDNQEKAFNDIWKHAIHSIVIQPLMIIFELESFKELEKYILCKPLLKGLFQELTKIYITKLKYEDVDLKNLKAYFKWLFSMSESLVPLELIEFECNLKSNFDLNILYPILLADDLKEKIPYLEFLYSILQQLDNYRHNNSRNFILKKKYSTQLQQLTLKLAGLEQQLSDKVAVLTDKLQVSETGNGVLNQKNENLANENDALKHQLELQVSDFQRRIHDLGMLNNDFLEQLSVLKLNQKDKVYRKSMVSNLQVTSGDDEDYVDAKDTVSLQSANINQIFANVADSGEPQTPVSNHLRKSRSIQGVNAQFSSPRSNTEVGMKALQEVQMFSEYGIFYGSPEKPFQSNGTNSTDTAVTEKEYSLEPQNGIEQESYEDKTIKNEVDISMEDLKEKQIELQKRELLLEQRERMLMNGNVYPPPPPKQQFPPVSRKVSTGNMNKQIQFPSAMRMSFMPQQQNIYDANGNLVVQQNLATAPPTTPVGNTIGNAALQQQHQFIPNQQQMYYQPNVPGQQYNSIPSQVRSISQPVQGSGSRIFSNGSGGTQQFLSQQPPQQHHPQYIKTSRKNRTSVVIPSASKVKQNLNYNIINNSGNNNGDALTNKLFEDFGSFSTSQLQGSQQMSVNTVPRILQPQKSYQNLSKKNSTKDLNGSGGFVKGNILPPGFTNGTVFKGSNGSSNSMQTYGSSSLKHSNLNTNNVLQNELKEEDENVSSVAGTVYSKREAEILATDITSDEFKLDSNSPVLKDEINDLVSVEKSKEDLEKKPNKLSKIFGRRKVSV
ncbi:hypothetical protein QEN19_002045 [Hanseniaspora menglaensis]